MASIVKPNLLYCRTQAITDSLADKLQQSLNITKLPLLSFEPAPKTALALDMIKAATCLVFTSSRAVDFAWLHYKELLRNTDKLITAIGDVTAAKLKTLDLQTSFIPTSFTSEALASLLNTKLAPGSKVVIFCGQTRRGALTRLVQNFQVAELVCYSTLPIDYPESQLVAALRACDIILITSEQAIKHLITMLPSINLLQAKPIITISGRLQQILKQYGLEHIILAANISATAILKAIKVWSQNGKRS